MVLKMPQAGCFVEKYQGSSHSLVYLITVITPSVNVFSVERKIFADSSEFHLSNFGIKKNTVDTKCDDSLHP